MRLLSRDFTVKEKILLLVLVVILVGLVYYQFVDQPVRNSLELAASQKASLETELEAVRARITLLERMKNEIEDVTANGTLKEMPSYNNSKNVNKLLNDVLGDMGYSIIFSNVSRQGNLVRRNITLRFEAPSYGEVRRVLSALVGSDYRCLIGDVRCTSAYGTIVEDVVTVNASITFYETVVGGESDTGLPNV